MVLYVLAFTPFSNLTLQNSIVSDNDSLGILFNMRTGGTLTNFLIADNDIGGNAESGLRLTTGDLSGYIWSANAGWISLNTLEGKITTFTLRMAAITS